VDGGGRVGASLQVFSGINIDATLNQTITDGVPGSVMPAWGQANGGPLTPQDVTDIVSYIQSAFGGTQPLEPLPAYQPTVLPTLADVVGDPSLGSVVYQENCAVCHGDSGQGRIGRTLAKSWSGDDPARYVHDVVDQGIAGSQMPAWGQERGGPLSQNQIADVTAYVLSLRSVESLPTPTPAPAGPISMASGLIALVVLAGLLAAGLLIYYRRA
jgi:cytochrome c oxidase cbb3-type subunit 3